MQLNGDFTAYYKKNHKGFQKDKFPTITRPETTFRDNLGNINVEAKNTFKYL